MAQSRKQFVESHGATCKNWRWSWSFVNEKEKFVIFGAWADRDMRLDENTYMILNEEWERGRTGRKQAAYRRAKDPPLCYSSYEGRDDAGPRDAEIV